MKNCKYTDQKLDVHCPIYNHVKISGIIPLGEAYRHVVCNNERVASKNCRLYGCLDRMEEATTKIENLVKNFASDEIISN